MKKDQKKAIIVPVLEIGESILGGKTIGEPSILTLVERKTRYVVTKKLVKKKAEYVNQAVLECMKLYSIKSITADNGNEFSSLSKIEGLDVYFAHAYSSYERQWTTKRVHSEEGFVKRTKSESFRGLYKGYQ